MNRWMDCDWLDGPKFVAWARAQGLLTGRAVKKLQRRIWEWEHAGAPVTVWLADRICARGGRHISEIPDEVWLDKPPRKKPVETEPEVKRETVKRIEAGETTIDEAARDLNVSKKTISHWLHGRNLGSPRRAKRQLAVAA